MILVPKRKQVSKDSEGDVVINQYITNQVQSLLSDLGLNFNRLWVKERLRIPVGTDKYGA